MKNWMRLTAGLATMSVLAACSGGGDSGNATSPSTTASVTVSGKFNGLSLASAKPMFGVDIVPMANSYSVYCFQKVYGAGRSYGGPVDSSGSFSFAASFLAGAPIGCVLEVNDLPAALFSFKRAESTAGAESNIEGYSPKQDTTALNFGDLTVSGSSVLVEPTNIVDNGSVAPSNVITDMTGSWTIASVYENAEEGYIHPCDMDDLEGEALAACKTKNWASIYLNMYKFTKSGADDRYGMSLWQKQTDFEACEKKEGFTTLGSGWSVATGFNANGSTVGEPLPTASLDMSNLDTATLSKAPFNFYSGTNDYGFYSNCPIIESQSSLDDVPTACKDGSVKTCGDFTAAQWESGLTGTADEIAQGVSDRKVRCVMNTLTSGGETGFNWGASCGRRLDSGFWNSMSSGNNNYGWGRYRNMKNDGKGCINADCSMLVDDPNPGDTAIAGISGYWQSEPKNRLLKGEVSLLGNVATGTTIEDRPSEHVDSYTCPVVARFTYTFTKTGENTMSFFIEHTLVKGAAWGTDGKGTDAQCLGTTEAPTWLGRELARPIKMKMNLTK